MQVLWKLPLTFFCKSAYSKIKYIHPAGPHSCGASCGGPWVWRPTGTFPCQSRKTQHSTLGGPQPPTHSCSGWRSGLFTQHFPFWEPKHIFQMRKLKSGKGPLTRVTFLLKNQEWNLHRWLCSVVKSRPSGSSLSGANVLMLPSWEASPRPSGSAACQPHERVGASHLKCTRPLLSPQMEIQ